MQAKILISTILFLFIFFSRAASLSKDSHNINVNHIYINNNVNRQGTEGFELTIEFDNSFYEFLNNYKKGDWFNVSISPKFLLKNKEYTCFKTKEDLDKCIIAITDFNVNSNNTLHLFFPYNEFELYSNSKHIVVFDIDVKVNELIYDVTDPNNTNELIKTTCLETINCKKRFKLLFPKLYKLSLNIAEYSIKDDKIWDPEFDDENEAPDPFFKLFIGDSKLVYESKSTQNAFKVISNDTINVILHPNDELIINFMDKDDLYNDSYIEIYNFSIKGKENTNTTYFTRETESQNFLKELKYNFKITPIN